MTVGLDHGLFLFITIKTMQWIKAITKPLVVKALTYAVKKWLLSWEWLPFEWHHSVCWTPTLPRSHQCHCAWKLLEIGKSQLLFRNEKGNRCNWKQSNTWIKFSCLYPFNSPCLLIWTQMNLTVSSHECICMFIEVLLFLFLMLSADKH